MAKLAFQHHPNSDTTPMVIEGPINSSGQDERGSLGQDGFMIITRPLR